MAKKLAPRKNATHKKKRGGARPGSGRKASSGPVMRKAVKVPVPIWLRLQARARDEGISDHAALIEAARLYGESLTDE